jgi:apolipoprotein D and lipocalin family protein
MRLSSLAAFSSVCLASGTALLLANKRELPVVDNVDLTRYSGKWFEIARLPASFERKCTGDVTATYALKPEGTIEVRNACRQANGKMTESTGTARLRDKAGPNSKLKVTFFWPFSGDYWILDLDQDYQWALVGTPDRKYLWILSRTPGINADVYGRLIARAKSLGFDISRMQRTQQAAAN